MTLINFRYIENEEDLNECMEEYYNLLELFSTLPLHIQEELYDMDPPYITYHNRLKENMSYCDDNLYTNYYDNDHIPTEQELIEDDKILVKLINGTYDNDDEYSDDDY